MKNLIYILTGAIGLFSLGVLGGKSSNDATVNCSGDHASCGPLDQHGIETSVKLKPDVHVRGLSHLFYARQPKQGVPLTTEQHARMGSTPHSPQGVKALSGGQRGGGKQGIPKPSHDRPIYIKEIVSMIKNNQRLPAPLRPHVEKKAKQLGLQVPDPATQKPTPPHLAGHPSKHAIEKLYNDDIPQEIIAAAQAAWGHGKAQKTNNNKMNSQATSLKNLHFPSGFAKRTKHTRSQYRRDPYAGAEAEAGDSYLDERDLFDDEFGIYGREAENDGFDLEERDLEDGGFDLYEREVESGELDLFARDAGSEWLDAY